MTESKQLLADSRGIHSQFDGGSQVAGSDSLLLDRMGVGEQQQGEGRFLQGGLSKQAMPCSKNTMRCFAEIILSAE